MQLLNDFEPEKNQLKESNKKRLYECNAYIPQHSNTSGILHIINVRLLLYSTVMTWRVVVVVVVVDVVMIIMIVVVVVAMPVAVLAMIMKGCKML